MAQATKETKSKALSTARPVEVLPRAHEVERSFDRMVEEFWRQPFPSLLGPERWFDRMVEEFWRRPFPSLLGPAETGIRRMPVVDIYEDKDVVVVKAELPGLSKEDISVQIADSTLTIKGEKKREEEIKEEDYYCCERSFGPFARTIDLPSEVKADQVNAVFKNGVLEVRMPKTEDAKKKSITIRID
jgi:HSP20 family protein